MRDGGFGRYIANPFAVTAPVGGPYGPVIGPNGPAHTRGGVYVPFMIHRFNRLSDANVLSTYYTMSTWNPYTMLLMRSTHRPPRGCPAGPSGAFARHGGRGERPCPCRKPSSGVTDGAVGPVPVNDRGCPSRFR